MIKKKELINFWQHLLQPNLLMVMFQVLRQLTSYLQVLVTIYWLGRAASKLPQYHGAPLNRKAFATLLAQSEETDETDSVLGSSWELEQSDTPSPHSCPQSHSDSLRPHDRVCCSLDSEH
uniref:Uncharacterized protein n=1 Tax=Eptatretus burgeri TaxID=7764 RepID=A0A8C4QXG8_EPTBU